MTPARPLLHTGVPGLDQVLGGGLLPSSFVLVVGPSGAGKTILSSQALFENASSDTPVLLFTMHSENHVKLIEHLRAFTFFEEEWLGTQVYLYSLQAVVSGDIESSMKALQQIIRQHRARLVLLDGFQGAHAVLRTDHDIAHFLSVLATLATYLGVTFLVTVEGNARSPALAGHLTAADVVIGLEYTTDKWRHVRRLDVVKQRGREPMSGLHVYRITAEGVAVYPRLEARPFPSPRSVADTRVVFNLPELDALLGGGLPVGTSTVLLGATGIGKTMLGLYWALAAVSSGSSAIFLSFAETPEQLIRKAATFGLDLNAPIASGALQILSFLPVEVVPDIVAAQLLDALTERTERVVIDNLGSLLWELDTRAQEYLAALDRQLHTRGITSLLLHEIEPFTDLQLNLTKTPLSLIADNVLVAQQGLQNGEMRRFLTVLKMRFSDYDRSIREFVLNPEGIRIVSPEETTPGAANKAVEDALGSVVPGMRDAEDADNR